MPISTEHEGRSYPATAPYRVSAAKIAEFAAALGAPISDTAPPTFAMVIAARAWQQLFDDPDLGLALHRVVHADQKFVWQRPMRAGDSIQAVLTIDRVRTRGATDLVTVTVALQDSESIEVATATSTLLHTRQEGPDA